MNDATKWMIWEGEDGRSEGRPVVLLSQSPSPLSIALMSTRLSPSPAVLRTILSKPYSGRL